jgi:hypothetical protein
MHSAVADHRARCRHFDRELEPFAGRVRMMPADPVEERASIIEREVLPRLEAGDCQIGAIGDECLDIRCANRRSTNRAEVRRSNVESTIAL